MAGKWYRLEDRRGAADAVRRMGEEDLHYLNGLIVERLKLLSQARSTALLAHFNLGDRVGFPAPTGGKKTGVILKLNKKTATIRTDDGQQWNVHPGFLTSADRDGEIERGGGRES